MLTKLYYLLQTRLTEEEGQDLVEYALLVAMLSIAAIAVLPGLATAINGAFTSVTNHINSGS